jgi:serine-type D-Ala-D-Ala carboxypeptidase/endopeptidase (penicillin-binding protein 4)
LRRCNRLLSIVRTLLFVLITIGVAVSAQAQKPRRNSVSGRAVKIAARAVPRTGSAAARNRSALTTSRRAGSAQARPKSRARTVQRVAIPALAPLLPGTAFGLDGLRADLGTLAGTSIRSGSWGMMVVSLSHGDTLFSINADVPHLPASTQKVLTSALALSALGPQYRYHTEVLRTGTMRDGNIDGDLLLRGDGDPSLSSRFIGGKPDAAMDSLAMRVVRAGVRSVSGRVIGDASAFEARSIPEGWHPRILQDAYAGRVSALSLNENLVWVTIRPGTRGGAADVVLEPATAAIPVRSTVRTIAGRSARLKLARTSSGISVSGSIGTDVFQRSYSYIVEDPASFTTGAFLSALDNQSPHGIRRRSKRCSRR